MPAGLSTELGELAKAGRRAHAKAKSSIGKPFTSTVPVVPAFEKRALSRPKSIMQVRALSCCAGHVVAPPSALHAEHTSPAGCTAWHGPQEMGLPVAVSLSKPGCCRTDA